MVVIKKHSNNTCNSDYNACDEGGGKSDDDDDDDDDDDNDDNDNDNANDDSAAVDDNDNVRELLATKTATAKRTSQNFTLS